jgi:ribose/xylose/arabinose/galactoside ABC-type transport system permease subunit
VAATVDRRLVTSPIALGAWVLTWLALATAATAWVAHETTLGPVLVTLGNDQRHGHRHGIHVGDLVAATTFFGIALVVTFVTVAVQLARVELARRRTTTPPGA